MADEIQTWLEQHGLGNYTEVFAENDIDSRALPHLSEGDLRELGLSMGHRKIFLAALAVEQPRRHLHADGSHAAERRQLTVMFCDLVGSTSLSQALDPEDLREVMRRYQDRVAGAITRYGGHVAKYLGDGVLAYFGWPRAYEDQSDRAVRAGLDAILAVREIDANGEQLAARVGIATGEVVIGDLAGEADAITGETPNLAARLQEAAAPGQVVLGETTHRLVEGVFDFEDLGNKELRGFADPVPTWKVVGESAVESRFEAIHGTEHLPLVGREEELEALLDCWHRAKSGQGQAVCIAGEAGIGKSRLVRALKQRLSDESLHMITYQCSPLQKNTPFHPVIRRLEYALGKAGDGDDRLLRLERLLRESGSAVEEVLPFFADLLSIPFEDRYPRPKLSPLQWKERTVQVLTDQLADLAEKIPVFIVMEDIHWADASTLELMASAAGQALRHRVLSVITARPEIDFAMARNNPSVTLIELQRISLEHVSELLHNLDSAGLFDAETIEGIAARADGVPLFVEELARGMSHGQGNGNSGSGIPESLQAALTARLDRLGQSKEVVQSAAVIGREFSSRLLAALVGLPPDVLDRGLETLCDDGIIVAQEEGERHDYRFKHALIQEAAYSGVLRDRRRQLHSKLAGELMQSASADLEVIARHLSLADRGEEAIDQWRAAARLAAGKYAHAEAAKHLEAAIETLDTLAKTEDRYRGRARLMGALSSSVQISRSFSDPTLERLTRIHIDWAERFEDNYGKAVNLIGLGGIAENVGNFPEAFACFDHAEAIISRLPKQTIQAGFYRARGVAHLMSGDLRRGQADFHDGIVAYDEHGSGQMVGGDTKIACLAMGSLALALLGRFDQALSDSDNAVRLAREGRDPASLAFGVTARAFALNSVDEPALSLPFIDELRHLLGEYGMSFWRHWEGAYRGRALLLAGEHEEAVRVLRDSVATARRHGLDMCITMIMRWLADGCLATGKNREAGKLLAEAQAEISRRGEGIDEVAVLRASGDLKLATDRGEIDAALEIYHQALEMARRQGAKQSELDVAMALARLLGDEGRRPEAVDILTATYGGFTEGHTSKPLMAARTLLARLA